MKNYMVTHTFKSKEMKSKFSETVASMKMEDIIKSMTSDKAACQMTWNTPADTMQMFCWWKGNSEEDIICLLYTSPSPRDSCASRMPSSA